MKIGVMNLFLVNNYGAVLQAFALEKTIQSMGHDVETVSYVQKISKHIYNKESISRLGLKGFLLRAVNFVLIMDRRESAFNKFRKSKMNCSLKYDESTIKNVVEDYERIVVGSDIVWSTDASAFDRNLFLPFNCDSKKKISYAASIGGHDITAHRDFVKKCISDFSKISCRETTTCTAIKELTGKDSVVVPDPVFLLSRTQWEELCEVPNEKEKYIFVYQLRIDPQLVKLVDELSKKTGCKVIYCPFPMWGKVKASWKPWISPGQWLGYLREAEYVVTDSFHAVCFSCIFERKFFVKISAFGSRITHRLEKFGLSKRLVTDIRHIDTDEMNFTNIRKTIEEERLEGLRYLYDALPNEE